MNDVTSHLLYYYDRHPISRDIILAKLQANDRGHLKYFGPDGKPYLRTTQDHYGGLKAIGRTGAASSDRVAAVRERSAGVDADFCTGFHSMAAPCVTLPTSTEPMSLELNSRLCASQARKI